MYLIGHVNTIYFRVYNPSTRPFISALICFITFELADLEDWCLV